MWEWFEIHEKRINNTREVGYEGKRNNAIRHNTSCWMCHIFMQAVVIGIRDVFIFVFSEFNADETRCLYILQKYDIEFAFLSAYAVVWFYFYETKYNGVLIFMLCWMLL